LDPARLRENFAQVAMHGDAVALFFYSDLFLRHPDVVARSGSWAGRDAYLAGPTPMVEGTAAKLAAQGVPQTQIHVEDFGWSEP